LCFPGFELLGIGFLGLYYRGPVVWSPVLPGLGFSFILWRGFGLWGPWSRNSVFGFLWFLGRLCFGGFGWFKEVRRFLNFEFEILSRSLSWGLLLIFKEKSNQFIIYTFSFWLFCNVIANICFSSMFFYNYYEVNLFFLSSSCNLISWSLLYIKNWSALFSN
jgi:hypothetical protein